MGIPLFGSNSWSSFDKGRDRDYTVTNHITVINNNPNPRNYKVLNQQVVNGFLILIINYPDSKNYEGNKVLVFDKNVKYLDLIKQVAIDPHFSNNEKYHSPIARFEPTDRGINMAVSFCENYK